MLFLNIGCGDKPLDGFVNIDIQEKGCDIQLDVRNGLPYQNKSVDGIYCEHFLEHLSQAEGMRLLRECRRVLKKEGRIRIAMPDLDEIVQRYLSQDWRGDGDMFRLGFDWVANRCEMLNISMREWGHKHIYTEEEAVRLIRLAGLKFLGRFARGESPHEKFRGLETRKGSRLIIECGTKDRCCDPAPLVSILIPAYNPKYFPQALKSALAQTYKNTEIIICDDSSSDTIETCAIGAAGDDKRVKYIRNQTRQGGMGNYLKCLQTAKGTFIKFLNDDDLLATECVERMVRIFLVNPDVTMVTSRRALIDEFGNRLPDTPATKKIFPKDVLIKGDTFAACIMKTGVNFIGEPTTVMFRRQDVLFLKPHFMNFGGREGIGLGDIALALNLLSQGDAVYFRDILSYFRIHPDQRQHDPEIKRKSNSSWRWLKYHARRLGILSGHLAGWIYLREIRTSPKGQISFSPDTWKRTFILPALSLQMFRLYSSFGKPPA